MSIKKGKMISVNVAGVFLERSRGFLALAEATKPESDAGIDEWEIKPLDGEVVRWSNQTQAKEGIRRLGKFILESSLTPKSVAISSYGPFLSLTKNTIDLGKIHHSSAHQPLQGLNLNSEFQDAIGKKIPLCFHTDAHATALGEAINRNIGEDEILGYICATDGVGLGIVRGRTIIPSALHPEIGLIPLRIISQDPLPRLRHVEGTLEAKHADGLEQRASNESMENRLSALKERQEKKGETPQISIDIDPFKHHDFCDYRAFYLAQACMALVTVNPPHYVVIGADKDPENKLADLVRDNFYTLFKERADAGQPVFEYDHFNDEFAFISESLASGEQNHMAKTGLWGMCYRAAQLSMEPKD